MNHYEKLKDLIAENLGCDKEDISKETNLVEDLEADSLDIVELTMAIEEEFGVAIEDEDLEHVKTVGDILAYLEN
ncbi:MAG: acyl carrier protein [Tissierellia bacterium]|nr:acyl carrier protein [Tissierellia bacterium]